MTNQREIVAQVRRMAERPNLYVSTLDVGALLALLEVQQAVVDAARVARNKMMAIRTYNGKAGLQLDDACKILDAALEKVKP